MINQRRKDLKGVVWVVEQYYPDGIAGYSLLPCVFVCSQLGHYFMRLKDFLTFSEEC